MLLLVQLIVREAAVAGDILGGFQRDDVQTPAAQRAECVMPDDATEPARKGRWVGEGRQA